MQGLSKTFKVFYGEHVKNMMSDAITNFDRVFPCDVPYVCLGEDSICLRMWLLRMPPVEQDTLTFV